MAAMAMAVGISEVYLIAQQAEPFVSAASRSLRPSSNTLNSGRNLISETENYPPGTFSIRDWSNYPEGNVPKPSGPFRLLNGNEYELARKAADQANRALHLSDPALDGLRIHEIHPVKFGGSPTDITNKIALTPSVPSRYTSWWNQIQRLVEMK